MSPLAWWLFVALVVMPVAALSVHAIVDLVRRDDVPPGHKAAWIAAVVLLPLFGGVLYLIFRPTRQDDIRGFGARNQHGERARQLLGESAGGREDPEWPTT